MKKIVYLTVIALGLYANDGFGMRPGVHQNKEPRRVMFQQLNSDQVNRLRRIVHKQYDRNPTKAGLSKIAYQRLKNGEATINEISIALGLLDAFSPSKPVSKPVQKRRTRNVADRQLSENEITRLAGLTDEAGEILREFRLTPKICGYLEKGIATESEVKNALFLLEAYSSPETQSDEDPAVDALARGMATVSLSDGSSHALTETERIARVTQFFIDRGSRELTIFSEFLSGENPLGMPNGENDGFVNEICSGFSSISNDTKLIMDGILEFYQENYQRFKIARLNAFFRTDGDTFLRFLAEKNPLGMSAFVQQVAYDFSNVDAMPVEKKLFLDGILNANWSEYRQFKRSHLFVTGLPNRPMVKVLDTIGDGDCAFRSMAPREIWRGRRGVTRQWAADLLLEHIGDAEVRRHVGAEIAYRRAHRTLPRAVSAALTRAKGDTTAVSVVKSYINNFVRPDVVQFAARVRNAEANYLEMPSPAMATSVATALAYLLHKNLIVINAEDGTVLYNAGNAAWPNLIVAQDGPNHMCRTRVVSH